MIESVQIQSEPGSIKIDIFLCASAILYASCISRTVKKSFYADRILFFIRHRRRLS